MDFIVIKTIHLPNPPFVLSGHGEQAAGRWEEHHRPHQRTAEDVGDKEDRDC